MEIYKNDIVIYDGMVVQVLRKEMENGVIVQDIHTKTYLAHVNLLSKAQKDEVKWFCEMSEHINFTPPNQEIRIKLF